MYRQKKRSVLNILPRRTSSRTLSTSLRSTSGGSIVGMGRSTLRSTRSREEASSTLQRANAQVNHARQEAHAALHSQEAGCCQRAQSNMQTVLERTEAAVAVSAAEYVSTVNETRVQQQRALNDQRIKLLGRVEQALQVFFGAKALFRLRDPNCSCNEYSSIQNRFIVHHANLQYKTMMNTQEASDRRICEVPVAAIKLERENSASL